MSESVELNDVQGIIIKGYGNMPFADYIMVSFSEETEKAKQWVGKIAAITTDAKTSTKTIPHAVNIAFTNTGILKLGFTRETLSTFPREFEEGMVTEHRQRILGDFGESDPKNWDWGKPDKSNSIDACLMLYAKDKTGMDQLVTDLKADMSAHQISIVKELPTNKLPHGKEHFGFRDGIADPVPKNADRREEEEHPANLINPGEFIFGYRNEYNKYPVSPAVSNDLKGADQLNDDPEVKNMKDLGRNGSMLVFRQMEQKVMKFWQFIDQAVKEQQVDNTSDSIEGLAAKMVGRWLNGSPLTKYPDAPNPDLDYSKADDFGYAKGDFDGLKCPIGSHIRRTNPRDNFLRNSTGDPDKDIEKSLMFMKRFRILRRGRSYGTPIAPSMDPQEVLDSGATDGERGLHFICFNTSIGRQFELIQQTWINNPKFAGLYEDPDPLIGYPKIMGEEATTTFTEQAVPVRKRVKGIPRFVEIKGGAYFFMPGLKALRFMSIF
ncbi:MAG: Dyp-type peroxidase [Cyclobacteriaceae bacterium]